MYTTNSLSALKDHLGHRSVETRMRGLWGDETGKTEDETGYLVV
jgi:hypothetical protein